MGMFPEVEIETSGDMELKEGDVLVLITDGIPESEGPKGEFFETDRLLAVIREHRTEPAEHIVLHVRRAIHDFTEGAKPADDLTIVVCRVL